jgi:hypothetical protein
MYAVAVDGSYCALPAKLAVTACCPSDMPAVGKLNTIDASQPLTAGNAAAIPDGPPSTETLAVSPLRQICFPCAYMPNDTPDVVPSGLPTGMTCQDITVGT